MTTEMKKCNVADTPQQTQYIPLTGVFTNGVQHVAS